jgi:putative DNA methylase
MSEFIKSPRKLVEVALPLEAINVACAYEKMPGIGAHPRGIHLWWARRPLAAARAILFAQLVNDPGTNIGKGFKYGMNKKEAAVERKRLFKIIEDLVKWENSSNEEVLERARVEIRRSWREVCVLNKDHPQATELFNPDKLPAFHDPFAGGGTIPLEAQRLGLQSYASDLNPVAVLINKAMIEIPPKFARCSPVGAIPAKSEDRRLALTREWKGATGLAEDVRRYGAWMRDEAHKRIGHLYPPIEVTVEMARNRSDLKSLIGKKITAIAWLWARTVKSPNPAFSHVEVPLISTFVLANKEGKEAYVKPIVTGDEYYFTIKLGAPTPQAKNGTKAAGRGANFRCIVSGAVIGGDYIKAQGKAGRIGQRLMAIVAEGVRGRVYLAPTLEAEATARKAKPTWRPSGDVPARLTGGTCVPYGLKKWGDIFTPRQLVALTTLSDLLIEVRKRIHADALVAGLSDDQKGLDAGGIGATAYSEAISVYLAFAVNRCADFSNSVTRWVPGNQKIMNLFGKQAIPMTWDYPEAAILADTVGGFAPASEYIAACIEKLSPSAEGFSTQAAAQSQTVSRGKVISTDPPYYDNIAYADLSDFFYVWLRPALRSVFPTMLATMTVPKAEELVATPYRHGTREKAETFFLEGMTQVISNLAEQAHPEGPVTIYYAFKQSDTSSAGGTSSSGWETFLTAVLRAGFAIVGTWPLRSEQEFRMISIGNNALASSILLVCRKRTADGATISRREFLRELNSVLPEALDEMTKGAGDDRSPVAPVDLSQAIIGPGMAVFSKYTAVLEADGSAMSVRTALQLINRFLAEDDFDADTLFCLHWFAQHGWSEGNFGTADTLSRGKGTSVDGMREAGVLQSGGGKVRLLKWPEYPGNWNPHTDARTPIWEALHQLIRTLNQGGESSAGALLVSLGGKAEAVRQLAYRLYTLCERLGKAEDARAYNELITSWTGIESAAATASKPTDGLLPGFAKLEDLLNEPETLERNHRAPPGRAKRHVPTIRVRR